MSETPSYEYEVLHQFEEVFRDGEHSTRAATRDYQKVWENVIDNPPEEGVTPIVVYRMNGETCAAIAGMDELVDNNVCAMEIARLRQELAEDREAIRRLLAVLPDSEHEDDESWSGCWDWLDDAAQEAVKEARKLPAVRRALGKEKA